MIVILTLRRKEVSDIITGRITQCGGCIPVSPTF